MPAEKGSDTSAEVERLRAENAALQEKVAATERMSTGRSARARNGGAAAIMVVATLALALAIPAVWVNRMVTNTGYYVQTVSPLAKDTAVQDAVAGAASNAIITKLDLQPKLESRLPTDLAFLAAPITSAADGFIRDQATAFVRSDAFPKLWDRANEISHKALVAAVTGKSSGAVQVQAGTITLDLGVLVDQLVARLQSRGFGFAANLPTGAVNRTLTLYHSDTLAQASSLVDAIQRTALILPIVGLILAAGAVALAANRRVALLWLGWSLLVWTLLPLQAIYIGQSYFGQQLNSLAGIPTDAAQNAYGIVFAQLVATEQLFVAVSVIVIVAAMLAGPSRWATALRGGLSGGISGVSSHLELGRFGEWVGARMQGLRAVGYVLAAALLVFLPRPRTLGQVWWIVAFVVLWLLAVQVLGSGSKPAMVAAEAGPPAELPPPKERGDDPGDSYTP